MAAASGAALLLALGASGCTTDEDVPGTAASSLSTSRPSPARTAGAPTDGAGTAAPSPPTSAAPSPEPVPTRAGPPVRPVLTPSPAAAAPGVVVRLTGAQTATAQGRGPGVIAGSPAVRLALRLTNGSSQPLALDSTVVDLAVGPEAMPASLNFEAPTEPFGGRLAPGEEATAVYLFTLPDTARGSSVVTVSLGAGLPTVTLPLTL